jgi:hypothetical protein
MLRRWHFVAMNLSLKPIMFHPDVFFSAISAVSALKIYLNAETAENAGKIN